MKKLFFLLTMFSLLMPTKGFTQDGATAPDDDEQQEKNSEVSHTVTEEDLKENSELAEEGVVAGEEITIPATEEVEEGTAD